MSKRACRARTAAPVAMEMSRRFMGRLSRPERGQKRASQVLRRRFVILRLAAAELEQFERESDALWARLEALRGTVRTF